MLISNEVSKARVADWLNQATPIEKNPTWVERRLAIKFGAHTYLLDKEQVFQCAHCGHYDPNRKAQEVINFFQETFGIKPEEIEITCSVAVSDEF